MSSIVSLFDAANEALDCGDASKAFRIFMQDVKNGGMDSLNDRDRKSVV